MITEEGKSSGDSGLKQKHRRDARPFAYSEGEDSLDPLPCYSAAEQVSELLFMSRGLPGALDEITRLSMEALTAESAALMLYDRQAQSLGFDFYHGPAKEAFKPLRVETGQGIAGHVARCGRAEVVSDVRSDQRWESWFDKQSGKTTASLLAAPVSYGGVTVGVMELVNRRDGGSFAGEHLALLTGFAEMAGVRIEHSGLREERDLLRSFVPRCVSRHVASERYRSLDLAGRRSYGAVLFADIAGSGLIGEGFSPLEAYDVFKMYIAEMIREVLHYQGDITEQPGDGIMAVFSRKDGAGSPAIPAVSCALAIHRRVTALAKHPRLAHLSPAIKVRIGINTGPMVAGVFGAGSSRFLTYIGTTVDHARLFETKAASGETLLGLETCYSLPISFAALPQVNISTKTGSVLTAYRIPRDFQISCSSL